MSTKEETNFGHSLVMGRVRTFSIPISSLTQTQKISQNHTNSHIYKLFLSLSLINAHFITHYTHTNCFWNDDRTKQWRRRSIRRYRESWQVVTRRWPVEMRVCCLQSFVQEVRICKKLSMRLCTGPATRYPAEEVSARSLYPSFSLSLFLSLL